VRSYRVVGCDKPTRKLLRRIKPMSSSSVVNLCKRCDRSPRIAEVRFLVDKRACDAIDRNVYKQTYNKPSCEDCEESILLRAFGTLWSGSRWLVANKEKEKKSARKNSDERYRDLRIVNYRIAGSAVNFQLTRGPGHAYHGCT